jgi:hypothetical protein
MGYGRVGPGTACGPVASSQAEPLPRHLAGVITRLASAANLWPDTIDGARRRNSDLTDQGGATVAVALHASKTMLGKRARNAIEIAVVLSRESGPVAGKRATSAAAAAGRGCIRRFCCNALAIRRQIMHPIAMMRLFASAELSLGCRRPMIQFGAETLTILGWNRQSGGYFHLHPSRKTIRRCGLKRSLAPRRAPVDLAVRASQA